MISSYANIKSAARFQATGNSSNTDFSDADCLLFANQYYGQALSLLMGNEQANLYRDTEADTKNITAGSNLITPDADIQAILRVAIKYPSSGTYLPAQFISLDKITCDIDEYCPASFEYTFLDGSIVIFVGKKKADIEAVASGVKIYNYNEITELSGDSDTPKLTEQFRDYISCGMAWEYCNAWELHSKADRLKIRMQELEKALEAHNAKTILSNKTIGLRKENYE